VFWLDIASRVDLDAVSALAVPAIICAGYFAVMAVLFELSRRDGGF